MATIAVTTHPNQQTIEQLLLGVDPAITFGTIGTAVFGTATARTIRTPTPNTLLITPLDPMRWHYAVELHPSDQLPAFSRWYWSEHLGDVPTRVVFALSDVKTVGEAR